MPDKSRCKIEDLAEKSDELSLEELETVAGGMIRGTGGVFGGTLNAKAKWTKKSYNTATGQSWDIDYEDVYDPGD